MLILYARARGELSARSYLKYLKSLPSDLQEKNQRFTRWEDRANHLFGKMLLCIGLKTLGVVDSPWNDIIYNEFGRPCYKGAIDFNISHSCNITVCALCETSRIGIDIEKIAPVNFSDFDHVMTEEQWISIHSASDPMRRFFDLWTIKEAVIKADSRGLAIPLQSIQISQTVAVVESTEWSIKEFLIDEKYRSHFATSVPLGNAVSINEIVFDD